MIGTTLNHYGIVRALGAGGMGEVYLAEDARLKRSVAVKLLPPALSAQPERRERFEREAQTIAALNHPNIVTVYSVEHAADTYFITMEYVDGPTLAETIPKGGLPLRRMLTIAIQIVDAVSAAHERGIVHRDLKPANVMVASNDRVKVLDFGLAKLRDAAEASLAATQPTRELTAEGRIVGTVAYMSPEQAEGKTIDARSDIFSLGILLYQMATGDQPFKGETSLSILTAVIRDTPRTLSEINSAIPRDLSRIVRHCLVKDPARRYQSAIDLRNDLEELAQSLDSGELTAPTVNAPAARRRAPFAAMTIAAVAVGGLMAALWSRAAFAPGPIAPPTSTHRRVTQAEGVERFSSISPDGKWVVYSGAGATRPAPDLYLQSVTGQTAIALTKDASGGDTMPAFSPDGESIAFRSERDGGGIFVMGRTGESVRRLTTSGYYPAWFPDGRQIVYSTDGSGPEGRTRFGELWVVATSGGEPRRLFAGDAVQPRVSPHGKRIAFWSVPSDVNAQHFTGSDTAGSNRDIWTIDVGGAHTVRVTTHEANDWNPVWSPDGRWLYFLSNRSGSMNLWRVAIDEATGVTSGEPQALTAPAPYVADFSLAADGVTAVYASILNATNVGRVAFDSASGVVKGPVQPITTGTRDLSGIGGIDVTRDGRFIAASTSPRGQEDLYIIAVEGGAIRQLTNDFARDRVARWSPDGRHIVFQSDRAGHHELWSIGADGSGLRRLTTSPWRGWPALSRDGRRIAASDMNARQLFVYDAGNPSNPPETLPVFPDSDAAFAYVVDWSPSGQQLTLNAVGGGRGAWIYSFETRKYRRIGGGQPVWLADERRIVASIRNRLSIIDTASGEAHELLAIPGENLSSPRLAADDTQLFFLRSTIAGDIWLMRFGAEQGKSGR